MAFNENRFVRQTTAYNAGQITTAENPSVTPVLSNGPAWFTYASATDAIATIAAANYFADVVYMLSVNDRIDVTGSDASNFYLVATVDRDLGTITLVSYAATGVVGTANIQDDAVTTAKIADGAVTAAKIGDLEITNADVSASAAIDFSKLATLASTNILVGSAGGVATSRTVTGDVTIGNTGVTAIASGVIVNADVSATAQIAYSKLADLTSTQIIVGSAGNVPTAVAVTGDVTIGNTGVTAIASDVIVNADINSAAAIAYSKLATLASGNILVGSAGGVATSVTMSGDVAIIASGATTIQAGAIDSGMMNLNMLRYTTVTMSAAQFNGAYAAPHLLLAAGGANTLIVLEAAQVLMTYVSAQFANGGVAHIQYDSTANGAGVIASSTQAAANFFDAASTALAFNQGIVKQPFTTAVNKGLYFSNVTGAFDTGDSTFVVHLWYRVIPTV